MVELQVPKLIDKGEGLRRRVGEVLRRRTNVSGPTSCCFPIRSSQYLGHISLTLRLLPTPVLWIGFGSPQEEGLSWSEASLELGAGIIVFNLHSSI